MIKEQRVLYCGKNGTSKEISLTSIERKMLKELITKELPNVPTDSMRYGLYLGFLNKFE